MRSKSSAARDRLYQLMEQELQEQIDFTYAITSSLGDGIMVLDANGHISFVNPAVTQILGWTEDELLDQDSTRFVHPPTALGKPLQDADNPLHQVMTAGVTLRDAEGQFIHKDERILPVAYTASPIVTNEKIVGIVIVFRDITRRKAAQEALKRREEQLAAAEALTHSGGWEWDLLDDEMVWTDELYRIYGVDPEDGAVTFETFLDRVYSEDRERVNRMVQQALEDRRPFDFHHRLLRPDGDLRILHAQANVQTNEETEQVVRMWGTAQDVTEQKQAEEKVRRAKLLAERLINSSINGIVAFDRDCNYVVWNPSMEEMTGMSREEVLGRNAFELFPFLTEIGEDAHFEAALAGETVVSTDRPYNVPETNRSGFFEAYYSPLRDEARNIVGGLIMVRDITEWRNAEKARRRSEKRFRTIFEGAALGILLLNLNGRPLQSNPAAHTMLGYTRAELRETTLPALIHPRHASFHQQQYAEMTAGERESYQMELRCRHKEGYPVWVHLTASLLRSAGKPHLIIVMLKNIDDRKVIEAELNEVQRRLSRSREQERLLLAQELHDGPIQELYAAKFQLQLFHNFVTDEKSHQQVTTVQEILQNVNDTLRAICGDLRPPTLAPFGLEVAIRSHAERFQALFPDLVVQLDLTPDGQALPEPMRLTLFRIYQEMLNNVAKHAEAEHVLIRFVLTDDQVILEIQDDGIGFQVPQRWIQLAREGHLGLVGASERAEEIGGQLVLLSSPGKGTIVRMRAPRPDDGMVAGKLPHNGDTAVQTTTTTTTPASERSINEEKR